jgi:hypothetical protein
MVSFLERGPSMKQTLVALVVLLASVCVIPARAETPVRLLSGVAIWSGYTMSTEIKGTKGLRVNGLGGLLGGVFEPYWQCFDPVCVPGTVIDLRAFWSGGDFYGGVRLQGKDYGCCSGDDSSVFGLESFTGTVIAPEFTASGIANVSAPFTYDIRLFFLPPLSGDTIEFVGSGMATLNLQLVTWAGFGSFWRVTGATYAF